MTEAWFAIVALCLVMYVILDGYDLGIGIGMFFDRAEHSRRTAVGIVASVWDANESWLILLGVTLWAGFPEVYGVALPHMYLPICLMLIGLAVRGVSAEIISHATDPHRRWFTTFATGSLVAGFSQGVAFGSLTQTIAVDGLTYDGGAFDFLTPYSLLCGVAAVLLYAALGAGYLRLKTETSLAATASVRGRWFLIGAVIATAACALLVGTTDAPIDTGGPIRTVVVIALVVLSIAGAVAAWLWFGRPATDSDHDYWAYAGVALMTVSGLVAWILARYPVLLPEVATADETVSPGSTMVFLLIGVGINMPLVLFYNWFAHSSFRGRYVIDEAGEPVDVGPPKGTLSGARVQTKGTK